MTRWLRCGGLLASLVACGGHPGTSNSAGTGPAGYLMAAFTLPSGDAAADATANYTLQLNIPASAHKAALLAVESGLSSVNAQPEWRARMGFEARRRAHIDQVLAQPRLWIAGRPGPRRTACSATCGGNTMCWKGICTGTPTLRFIDNSTDVACTVVAVLPVPGFSAKVNVLLDNNNTVADATTQVVAAAQQFIATLPRELQILGQTDHRGAVDVDGDGRLTLVYTTENGTSADNQYLAGFFSTADVVASGSGSDGNMADILWARIPGTTLGTGTLVTPALLAGTMAHEYTHLTSYALRVLGGSTLGREDLWLDEGLAHAMEDLTGWSVSTATVYSVALTHWEKGGFASGSDSVEQRGRAYALVRYIIDQKAKQSSAADAGSAVAADAAAAVVGGLLRENALGFAHAPFAALGQQGVFNWLTSLYTSGNPNMNRTEAHAYDYLPTATNSTTQHIIGFNPRGTYQDASGQAVVLEGPNTVDLDASSGDLQGNLDESASALFFVHGFDPNNVQQTEAASANVGPFVQVVQVTGASP